MANYIYANGQLVSVDELRHYGILGMKWGVRRYQNADGSLTSAGKRRYGNDGDTPTTLDNKRKGKITDKELRDYRQEMIARYDKNSPKKDFYKRASDDQIREDIHQKQTMKKVALGVAAAAGIGVGIYAAYKFGAIKKIAKLLPNHKLTKEAINQAVDMEDVAKVMGDALDDTDIILKKGTVLHRMTAYADIDFSKVTDPTYVAYKERDVKIYKAALKDWSGTGKRYDVSLKAKKDIRMPNEATARKIFDDLWKSDPTYRQKMSNTIYDTYLDIWTKPKSEYGGKSMMEAQGWSINDLKSALKDFVDDEINKDPFSQGMYAIVRKGDDSKILINRYKERGYNALEDYFDKGTMAESPVILFNPSKTVVKTGESFVPEAIQQILFQQLYGI